MAFGEHGFWEINDEEMSVNIKWSRNCFEDYKKLAYQFYECGYKTFLYIVKDEGNDNENLICGF